LGDLTCIGALNQNNALQRTSQQFSTLSEMMPCNGYWVKVSADGELIYPSAAPIALASNIIPTRGQAATGSASYGQGDINVNDPIGVAGAWTAAGAPTTLTLNSARDVNINMPITATKGNLVACCGRDVNVRAAITTTNGSVLLAAGRDVTLFAGSAMTTTNGNIELCAGRDVIVSSKITLTNSGSIANESLGLPLGLTLIAGANATGPGLGGNVILPGPADPLRPTVTQSAAPATERTWISRCGKAISIPALRKA